MSAHLIPHLQLNQRGRQEATAPPPNAQWFLHQTSMKTCCVCPKTEERASVNLINLSLRLTVSGSLSMCVYFGSTAVSNLH